MDFVCCLCNCIECLTCDGCCCGWEQCCVACCLVKICTSGSCAQKMQLKTCWSPCFYHSNVRSGSFAVAYYTTFFSFVIIAYTSYVMSGGESSQYYLPFFETDVRTTTQSVGVFIIFFFLIFVACSILLVRGIQKEYRGFFFPWMICMALVITFQAGFGLWLIVGYYIYLWSVFVTICIWLWGGVNIYCFLCVTSQYNIVTEDQSRNIELLYP